MQKRVVLLGIIVENTAAVEQLNILLHAHLDAPADVISTLSGKIGMLKGVSVKALYAKAPQEQPF